MRSSISLVALGLASLASASGGFWNEGCRECNLWFWTINCKCSGDWSSEDLDTSIRNDNGKLRWGSVTPFNS
jgi:hypothetical protein